MTHLLSDDALVDDMAACLLAVRRWLMQLAEEWPDLDARGIDDLLRRYREETGHAPPSVDPEADQ